MKPQKKKNPVNNMFYSNQARLQKNLQALYADQYDPQADALNKADALVKGRRALPVGARKSWGTKEYVKTADGWKANKEVTAAHDKIHVSKKKPEIKTVDGYKKDFAACKTVEELDAKFKELSDATGYLPVREMQELDEYVDELEYKLKNPTEGK